MDVVGFFREAMGSSAGFRTLGPDQLGELRSDDMPGKIKSIRHKIRRHSPSYYDDLKSHIAEHGIQAPILVQGDKIMDGNHRAAIAHELGLSAPVGDYDDDAHHAAADQARRQSGWSDWEKRDEHGAHRR